jgi:hypothetical protein
MLVPEDFKSELKDSFDCHRAEKTETTELIATTTALQHHSLV